MDEKIIKYLQDNKDQYSQDILVQELEKAGYDRREISEVVKIVYKDNNYLTTGGKNDFWDFTSRKFYHIKSDKIKDFALGFFAPIIVGLFIVSVPFMGAFIYIGLYIFLLVYLFNKRRFVFYGMIGNFVFGFLLMIIAMIFISTRYWYF